MISSIDRAVALAKGLYAYVTLVRDPNQLGEVFELRKSIAQPEVLREMAEFFPQDERGTAALRDRPRLGRIDLAALAGLPKGTLGQVYAQHMIFAGPDPCAILSLPSGTELEFLDARTAFTSAALNRVITRYDYYLRRVALERAAASYNLTRGAGGVGRR